MISSTHQTRTFIYGSFRCDYELLKQNRKTFSLTVRPDLSIILRSPNHATDEKIEQFLKKKWFWLQKQLRFFSKYQHKHYKREYISGESLYYLGKQYQLIVKQAKVPKIALERGLFLVQTVMPWDKIHKKRIISQWFDHQTKLVFQNRLTEMSRRFEYEELPKLVILPMPRRWGSYVGKRKIILNPKLIYMPIESIDYVIVHEFCHFQVKSHSKAFFELLDKKYPRWEKIKEKLEILGALIN